MLTDADIARLQKALSEARCSECSGVHARLTEGETQREKLFKLQEEVIGQVAKLTGETRQTAEDIKTHREAHRSWLGILLGVPAALIALLVLLAALLKGFGKI
jgi:hypothetical protein